MSGFIYIWFDRKHKRYYIGSHWGEQTDGYVCSSRWMKQAYKHRKDDFRREILAIIETNRIDLLNEEKRWLSMIKDHELGKKYYNLNNKNIGHWTTDDQKYLTISQKISKAQIGKPRWPNGRPLMSQDQRQKISQTQKGRKRSQEFKDRHVEIAKERHAAGEFGMIGRIWCHDPITRKSKGLKLGQKIPEGFVQGRPYRKHSFKMKWCHDPISNEKIKIKAEDPIPTGYIKGMGPHHK